MMRPLFVPLLALGTGLLISQAGANPYGSQLSASASQVNPAESETVDLTFHLNEDADSVVVEVFGPLPSTDTVRSINMGALSAGAHAAEWDGKDDSDANLPNGGEYSFRVLTQSSGHPDWTNITPMDGGDQIASSQFPHPSGIAVIRKMDSPFFGVVGVANSDPSETGDFEAEEMGLYLLNGDLTWYGGDAVASHGAALNDPAAPWDAEDIFSPWKLMTGRDDGMFYLGDWGTTGTTDAVYRYDLENTAVQVLAPGAGSHGRVIGATTIGTGEDTVLIGLERDGNDADWVEIEKWDTGTDAPYTGTPEVLIPYTGWAADPVIGTASLSSLRGLAIDDDGNIYVGNRRWAAGDPRYIKFDSDGEPVWSRTGTELEAEGYPATAGDGIYPYGLSYHDGHLYAIDDFIKVIAVLDAETGAYIDSFSFTSTGSTVAGRDLDVDAAGNVYVADNDASNVSVWSPPGASDFTSTWSGSVMIGEGPLSVQSWTLYN